MLARLALAKDHRVGRDELAQQLWPDDFLDTTRVRLRQELSRLRQTIGDLGVHLIADRQVVQIASGHLSTDVQMFEDLISASNIAPDEQARVQSLADAVKLIHGPFMAGFEEPWVLATRRAYGEKVRRTWLRLADSHEALGQPDEALIAALNAVRHAPMDVEANTRLIRRLLDRGQAAQARQAFHDFDAMLFRELGQHASFSLKELMPNPEVESGPAPIEARASGRRPGPLYGRDSQVAAVLDALSRRGAGVVLVGGIGVGKTHLSREVAWQFSYKWSDLPVQFGGEALPVRDGLLVTEVPASTSHVRRAAENGWRVLVESRARLGLDGFAEVMLARLPVPAEDLSPAAILANPAVQILRSRVSEAEMDPAILADLARRTDGLPALLRTLATRLIVQPPDQILRSFDGCLTEFLDSESGDGETYRSGVTRLLEGLPEAARIVLKMLLNLDGASVELGNRLAAPGDPAEAWRALEARSLIVVKEVAGVLRYVAPPEICGCLLSTMDPDARRASEAETWTRVAEWALAASRGSDKSVERFYFNRIQAELPNLLNGLRWSVDHAPEMAGRFVAGLWRTVCARGNPSAGAELIRQAARIGAPHLPPQLAGEVWTGTGVVLSLSGLLSASAEAFESAIRVYDEAGDRDGLAWAMLNYGSHVLIDLDLPRATEMAKQASELTSRANDRLIALEQYAWGLAVRGEASEALRIGEEVFAERLKSSESVTLARAYGDLAELHIRTGRPEAAQTLLEESVRRFREAGIQDFLCQTLIRLAAISLDDEDTPRRLDEAHLLATALGSYRELLAVARTRLAYAYRRGDVAETIQATEEMMRFTHKSESPAERRRSLLCVAQALESFRRVEFANAARAALGRTQGDEDPLGPVHEGWKALLSSDSHGAVCALAAAMVKEALRM